MPALERNCTDDCRNTYIPGHSDWVDMSAIISTSPDQYRHYLGITGAQMAAGWPPLLGYQNSTHPSIDLFGFLSGRYEVAREEWNGIKLEVYYLKEQPWNVARMMNSMKKSLDYYIKNFGPYEHKEARIVEFPRVATFANHFPEPCPIPNPLGSLPI